MHRLRRCEIDGTKGEQLCKGNTVLTQLYRQIYTKYLNYMFRPLWTSSGWKQYQRKNYIIWYSTNISVVYYYYYYYYHIIFYSFSSDIVSNLTMAIRAETSS